MRRLSSLAALIALSASLAVGCGQQAQQAADTSSADSLLASNPIESPPPGDITPQTDFEQTPESQTPVSSTPSSTRPVSKPKPRPTEPAPRSEPGVSIATGTPLKVAFTAKLTSETAVAGDAWSGTLSDPVTLGDNAALPAGTVVHGVVVGAKPAQKGDRAVLVLAMTSLEVNGRSYDVSGHADSLIAGSTRGRNVGAVAGGAAAGALIGKAVGGSGKGALIGGLIGGAAATGAVAASKGYQVEVKEGAQVVFTVTQSARIKL
ncbi:MAG: hypothetical protein HOP12_09925 [Candidatus Eisenbacteria bacterium]|uniref:Glycine zipper 2TM domain-containing protein n=1 Tax=Eiseniibacteriota bacterium TaxID=2212470 RepID=A0A849SPA8_UNCEI|nr:hypothetical protein [Candidatus Eisenbacteria bacterium]